MELNLACIWLLPQHNIREIAILAHLPITSNVLPNSWLCRQEIPRYSWERLGLVGVDILWSTHWTYKVPTKNTPRSPFGYNILKLYLLEWTSCIRGPVCCCKYAGNSFIQKDQCYVFSVREGTILKDSILLAFLVYCLHIYYFSNNF